MTYIVSRRQPSRSVARPWLFLWGILCLVVFSGMLYTLTPFEWNQNSVLVGESVISDDLSDGTAAPDFEALDNSRKPLPMRFLNLEMDSPLNSLFNLFFPIDSIVSYNTTDKNGNREIHQFIGRYASFSTILDTPVRSEYAQFPNNACERIVDSQVDFSKFANKAVVVLRGDCTFVDKVENLVESGINPSAIIVANDEPYGGLITMYSSTYNQDGAIRIPIMFIAYEDYMRLSHVKNDHLVIELATASLGSWFGILLSMIVSPPLVIILFYLMIICGQKLKRRQINLKNARLVKNLPVFIYNRDHLIDANHFETYLKITKQSAVKHVENTISDSPKITPNSSTSHVNKIVVNGVDIKLVANSLHILTSPNDFYPSYKCSICLEKYVPLHTKVLVLECKHFYHDKCLSNWLINFRRSCPLCNRTLSNYDSYMLSRHSQYGSLDDEWLVGSGNESLDTQSSGQLYQSYENSVVDEPLLISNPIIDRSPEQVQSSGIAEPIDNHESGNVESFVEGQSGLSNSQVQNDISSQSDSSYTTAQALPSGEASIHSEVKESSSSQVKRQFYAKPLQILSQFTSSNRNINKNSPDTSFDGYSVSIDSHLYSSSEERKRDDSDQETIKQEPSTKKE